MSTFIPFVPYSTSGYPADPIVSGAATAGEVLTASGPLAATWQASSGGPPSGTAGGDLSGTYPNPTVTDIGGTPFALPVSILNGGTGQTARQQAINALAGAVTSGQYLRGNGTNDVMSAIQAGDVPTLNQSTTGNAATATLAANATLAATATLATTATTADGLATTGATVATTAAAPPTAGMMLNALTATTANWQFMAGSAWFNVLNYSADPTGATDCTTAFNNTIAAAAAAGGGVVYVPTGSYKITGAVAYTGTASLTILGDGPQATKIRMNNTATSSTYFSITNTGAWGTETDGDGFVMIAGMSFYNDHFVGSNADTNIGIYLSGVNFGYILNVAFYKGTGSQRILQAIVANVCNQVLIDNCNIFSVVNGITFTGECQVCIVRASSIWQPAGTGVATAASILISGQTLGVTVKDVIMHDGDRGILWTQDSGSNIPHLFFGYNVQPNNLSIVAMEFDYGAQVYLDACVFSGSAVSANVPGVVFGANFQGSGFIRGCIFSGQPGHSIAINGGTGFIIQGCEFGDGSGYKFAANTYDEINIAAAGEVTIDACHFNVDALAGIGSNFPPRSAVYVAAGVTQVTLTNSKGPGTGYGTATVVDNGAAGIVMKRGNIGLGLADSTTGTGNTVTAAAQTQLSASITVPLYDMVPGKVYRIRAWGHGTQAAGAAQNLSLQAHLGQSLGTWTAGTNPAAGAAFVWSYETLCMITAQGSSGTFTTTETFTWNGAVSQHGNNAGITVNTQANQSAFLDVAWAATTGAPTITCDGTSVEPIQNYPAS